MFKVACFEKDHIWLKMLQKEFIKSGNGDISIFASSLLATVISFCHTVPCTFFIPLDINLPGYISLCVYKNVVNEIKPSQLKNCLVLEDMKNTIRRLGKKV